MDRKLCTLCLEIKKKDEFKPKRNLCRKCWNIRHNSYLKMYNQTPKGKEYLNKIMMGWRARYIRCRASAKQRGIPFELTHEQFQAVCDKPCFYCGYQIKRFGHGIDRVDSKAGYTPNNIVSSCAECNWAKNAKFTFEEMIELGKTIREIRKKREAFSGTDCKSLGSEENTNELTYIPIEHLDMQSH